MRDLIHNNCKGRKRDTVLQPSSSFSQAFCTSLPQAAAETALSSQVPSTHTCALGSLYFQGHRRESLSLEMHESWGLKKTRPRRYLFIFHKLDVECLTFCLYNKQLEQLTSKKGTREWLPAGGVGEDGRVLQWRLYKHQLWRRKGWAHRDHLPALSFSTSAL